MSTTILASVTRPARCEENCAQFVGFAIPALMSCKVLICSELRIFVCEIGKTSSNEQSNHLHYKFDQILRVTFHPEWSIGRDVDIGNGFSFAYWLAPPILHLWWISIFTTRYRIGRNLDGQPAQSQVKRWSTLKVLSLSSERCSEMILRSVEDLNYHSSCSFSSMDSDIAQMRRFEKQ